MPNTTDRARRRTAILLVTALVLALPAQAAAADTGAGDVEAAGRSVLEDLARAVGSDTPLVPARAETPLTYLTDPVPFAGDARALSDPTDRPVAVVGELSGADDVAVVVPGVGNDASNFASRPGEHIRAGARLLAPLNQARALLARMDAEDPTGRHAVVAWLGYRPASSPTLDAVSLDPARAAAPDLARLVEVIRAAAPRAHQTWICHSYGSVVCAWAVSRLTRDEGPADVVLIGSPGCTADRAADLGTSRRVWAGLGTGDPIALVGLVGVFGPDPTDPAFGARLLDVGAGGHSAYYSPGSTSLESLTAVALGRDPASAPAG